MVIIYFIFFFGEASVFIICRMNEKQERANESEERKKPNRINKRELDRNRFENADFT